MGVTPVRLSVGHDADPDRGAIQTNRIYYNFNSGLTERSRRPRKGLTVTRCTGACRRGGWSAHVPWTVQGFPSPVLSAVLVSLSGPAAGPAARVNRPPGGAGLSRTSPLLPRPSGRGGRRPWQGPHRVASGQLGGPRGRRAIPVRSDPAVRAWSEPPGVVGTVIHVRPAFNPWAAGLSERSATGLAGC